MIEIIDYIIRMKDDKLNVDLRLDVGEPNQPEWIMVCHQSIII